MLIDTPPKCGRGHTKVKRNDRSRSKGWRWACDDCAKLQKDPVRTRDETLKRRYGITDADYQKMLLDQNGVCAICGRTNKSGRALHVDHDHATGKVRALLCEVCNTSLGAVENPELLEKLLAYLAKHAVAQGHTH